jgi:simple sugar transport system ATP-binding protein
MPLTVADNAVLVSHRDAPFSRRGLRASGAIFAFATRLIKEFAIRCPGPQAPIRSLSGGNQQKLVLGREIARDPKLLIAMQPTRGLDVGAIDYVHSRLIEARNAGTAILLISTELDEVMALSDRIAVLREGRIAGILARADATVDEIGRLMLGSTAAAA